MSLTQRATTRRLDLLCFSHLRWNFVTQRPQHLLTLAARTQRVFYWEEPCWHDEGETGAAAGNSLEVVKKADSLWVIVPHLLRGVDGREGQRRLLDDFIAQYGLVDFLTWYYTPMAYAFSKHLAPKVLVYDCMDQLSHFRDAPTELGEREKELLHAADVVFTGGRSLFEDKKELHTNVHLFPSSVDVAHFATAKKRLGLEPLDQRSIPEPRVGFYGVLDERFDLRLLSEMAARRPEFQFVILGPIAKIDPCSLPGGDNLHYLGSKTYEELPSYLAGWAAAILPFALNDSTRFISPTKTPEYLAAGRPVISTPIRDVVREYGEASLVQIAETPVAFAEALDQAMKPATAVWTAAVASKLAESSWESTWTAMKRLIEEAHVAKESGQQTTAGKTLHTTPPVDVLVPSLLSTQNGYRGKHVEQFDYVVAGAGFAGSVLAERLASQAGKKVLVVDKREHIGGNAYDTSNSDGLLIHKYGPHIFHTNSDDVVAYLSKFTSWRPYEHRVLSSVDGMLLPVPINLDTINRLYNLELDEAGMKAFLDKRTVQPVTIRTSEEIVVSRVGRELYEKFFRNYTRKQWGLDPSQLDAAVAGRIPVRFDRDDRYFTDTFQAMPQHGYTKMFERMLDQKGITVRLGVDFADIVRHHPKAKIIYTGPIDEYFAFKFGPLPYRSLQFRHETLEQETFQAAPVVNYPNEHEFTRITEFKYLTGQTHRKTSIVYEYPRANGDPYYPIPRPENTALFGRYRELAEQVPDVVFCGRLANYRYFNMDQVVAQALRTFRGLQVEQQLPLLAGSRTVMTSVEREQV